MTHEAPDAPIVGMTAADRALMRVRRDLSALTIDVTVSDVCPRCGLHIIANEAERLRFFKTGGSVSCDRCGMTKTYEVPRR